MTYTREWADLIFEVNCPDCEEGITEIGPECSRPASSCCGGCYHDAECPECDGNGHIEVDVMFDIASAGDRVLFFEQKLYNAQFYEKVLLELSQAKAKYWIIEDTQWWIIQVDVHFRDLADLIGNYADDIHEITENQLID